MMAGGSCAPTNDIQVQVKKGRLSSGLISRRMILTTMMMRGMRKKKNDLHQEPHHLREREEDYPECETRKGKGSDYSDHQGMDDESSFWNHLTVVIHIPSLHTSFLILTLLVVTAGLFGSLFISEGRSPESLHFTLRLFPPSLHFLYYVRIRRIFY